jgi:hypothetical protein
MIKRALALLAPLVIVGLFLLIAGGSSSCNIYRFKDVSIPDTIHSVKVNFFGNIARYVNPQLSPRLTDRLRQKIVSQTRLSQTNGDNADWEISGDVTDYSISTSAISGQQSSANRLTVAVHVKIVDRKSGKVSDYDVSRNFDFAATQSLQQAEASLADEMIRSLTDDVFNRIFSNW